MKTETTPEGRVTTMSSWKAALILYAAFLYGLVLGFFMGRH